MDKISGTLVYVCIPKPVKALQKDGKNRPDEWKASVVITDEDLADEFEAYGSSLETMVSCKKVKSEEFEAIYKCPLPEGAGKKVWVITLRKSTMLGATGKEVPLKFQPKVFQKIGNQTIEITNEKLVANGSKGTISIDKFDRTKGGSSLYLKNVLVTDLIEYVQSESDYIPGQEFNDEDEPAKVETKAAPAAKKAVVKPAKKAADDMSDDVPF